MEASIVTVNVWSGRMLEERKLCGSLLYPIGRELSLPGFCPLHEQKGSFKYLSWDSEVEDIGIQWLGQSYILDLRTMGKCGSVVASGVSPGLLSYD